jgi:hypothetical protein
MIIFAKYSKSAFFSAKFCQNAKNKNVNSVADSLKLWKKIAEKVEVLSWFRQI